MERRKGVWNGRCTEGRGERKERVKVRSKREEIDPLASCLASSAVKIIKLCVWHL